MDVSHYSRGISLITVRSIAPALLSAALIVGLVGCAPAAEPETSASPAPEPEASETSESAPVATGDYVAASWAKPITDPGELLTTITGEGFQVDIYQVGTAAATKTGNFANPDTNKPIIEVGAELVFVNYIVTNTSSEDIPLSYSLVDVDGRYESWPYLQGMDSVTDFDLDAQMNINNGALATGVGESPFIWEPGTSFSFGQNFLYEANGAITFEASLTPSLPDGDLDHDKNQRIEAATVIK